MKKSFTLRSIKTISSNSSDFSLIETYRRNLRNSALLLFLSLLAFVFLPYVVADANATTEVSATMTWTPISLTFSDGGDIDFGSIIPPADDSDYGSMKVAKQNVSIDTNARQIFVYLSTEGASNALTNGYDSNIAIPALGNGSTGTWANPGAFSGNGWGYAIQEKSVSGTTIYDTNFSADYSGFDTVISANKQINSTGEYSTLYNTGTWAGVPVSGSAQQIWGAQTTNVGGFGPNADNVRNNFDIYYAVMADRNLLAGTYSNKVVYTALASGNTTDSVSHNLEVVNSSSNGVNATTKRFVAKDDVLELHFDLAESDSNLISASDVKAYIVPHATALSANYTVNSAVTSAKVECPVSSFDIASGRATATCTLPDRAIVSMTSGVTEASNGYYDVLVEVTLLGNSNNKLTYFSQLEDSSNNKIGTIAYVGLQSISSNSNKYIIENMQDMTSSVCFNTNEFGTQYGANSTVYNYTGTGTALATGTNVTLPKSTPSNSAGTFSLKDTRDNKQYLVRRLADGNCWMVQNLDLDLAMAGKSGGYTMTKENTDITADTYTPTAYSSGTGAGSLNERIGSPAGCQQFVPYGGNTVSGQACFWGNKIGEDGSTLSEVTNNARAEMPRQYENGNDWIDNSNPNTDGAGSLYKTSGTPSNTSTDAANTQYMGNWYNWYAATAETGTWSMSSGNASGSICPKGWGLPENSGTQSWDNLLTTAYSIANSSAGSQKMRSVPLSIIFSGFYNWINGGLSDRGTNGGYWSSTPYASTNSRSLGFSSTNLGPQGGSNKSGGLAVRCVAR